MGITQQIGASSLIKPGVCTSSTRPASPYNGQTIFETDTNKTLVWNGTAWYPNWNTAWGVVAYTKTNTTNISYTAEAVTITSSSFTAVANRYYRATYIEGTTYGSVSFEGSIRTRLDTLTGTLIGVSRVIVSATGSTTAINTGLFTTTAGSHVVVGTLAASTGTGTGYRTDIGASIIVEDMGPA